MLRLTIVALFALGIFMPVRAQAVDPATFAPESAAMYAEIRVDENLESDLQELARIGAALSGESPDEIAEMISFDEALEQVAPGVTFEEDILPWLGDSAGVFVVGDMNQPDPDAAVILPVTDAAAAEAFVSEQLTEAFPDISREGDVSIHSNDTYQVVTTPEHILFGTPTAVATVLAVRQGTSAALATDEAFLTTRAALPSDPFAWAYISGRYIDEQSTAMQQMNNYGYGGVPGFNELFEAAMRLHPAESAMEDAILGFPALNGLAFAFEFDDTRLDVTSVISMKAEYPAPTLPTTTAGTTLLPYIPANAYTVLASYDLTATLGVSGGWAGFFFLLGPSIGSIFDSVVFELENPGQATPTPPPTPTPIPTPTANDLVTEAQPYVQQAEALLGIGLEELYGLISGEYALAAFPVDNPATENLGFALWLQTDDPARLSQVVDSGMSLLSMQMASSSTSIERTEENVSGLDLVVWTIPDMNDGLVYGELAEGVFVLALKSSLNAVISSSRGDGVLSQSRNWPADIVAGYGDGVEALFYMDISGVMKLNPQPQTGDSPIAAVVANLDFRDNGLFVSQTTLTRLSE
jgi:hypothetical protein